MIDIQRATFDRSAGSRERGKFRLSSVDPDQTTIAVVRDDGKAVTKTTEEVLNELLLYQRAIVLGLSILTETDLLAEV